MFDFLGNEKRTDYASDLSIKDVDKKITLMGWVHRRRDLGGLIFIDLRDVSGLIQIVFRPDDEVVHEKAGGLRNEYIIAVEGVVTGRDPVNINRDMKTGDIEVVAEKLLLLNDSEPLPIQVNEKLLAEENLRLKYRYLDLRRRKLQDIILLRHNIVFAIREFLVERGFYEIETPVLMKSTPEGARDYLVPSRVFKGKFFALPQSPQIYKQLLMISGFDRTTCFNSGTKNLKFRFTNNISYITQFHTKTKIRFINTEPFHRILIFQSWKRDLQILIFSFFENMSEHFFYYQENIFRSYETHFQI